MPKSDRELEDVFKKHFNRNMPGVKFKMINYDEFRSQYRTLVTKVIIPSLREMESKATEEFNGPISDLHRTHN